MPNFDNIENNTTSTAAQAPKTERANDAVRESRDEVKSTKKSLLAAYGRRYMTNQSNQYLDQVELGLVETLKKFNDFKDLMQIVKIGTAALRYPAVALCQKFQAKGKTQVAYFVYPIQDRSVSLERKGRDQDRGGRRDVPPVPTDVIDQKYFAAVDQSIRESLRLDDNAEVHCAGVQLLGDLFKLDQKDYPEGYNKLVIAAIGQTDAVKGKVLGDNSTIIQGATIDKDSYLVGRIDYSPSINEDLAGNPIRSDLNLTIIEQARRNRNNRNSEGESYNGEAGYNSPIIAIDAMVNFIFTNDDEDRRDRRDSDKPQFFLPEIRITHVDNRLSPSLANMFYAISHIAALTQNENWVNCFAPNLVRALPGRNLGGLYTEQPTNGDPEEPVDLSDETIDAVFKMAAHCTKRDVLVTFMAPESSEYSRFADMLYILASNSVTSDEYLEVYDELMDEFEVMLGKPLDWSSRDPIFAGDQLHRCLIGHYQQGNEVLSTENIDYLSLINNSNNGLKPIQTATEWDNSYSAADYDEGTTTRARIVSEETDGMVRWTGAQNTLSISMPFLKVLGRALQDANLGIEIEDNSGSSDRRVRRPISAFSQFAGRSDGYSRRHSEGRGDRRNSRNGRGGRGYGRR